MSESKKQTETFRYTAIETGIATPMTLGEYNNLRGWDLPADEDPNEEGYMVEIDEKVKSDHDQKVVKSWRPKAVFEANLSKTSNGSEDDFITRLKEEASTLSERIQKLSDFQKSDRFELLNQTHQSLLNRQLMFMKMYLGILERRLMILIHDQEPGLTFGEAAVGLSFNPSFMPEVDQCKAIHAMAIDQMNDLRNADGTKARHASVAITDLETAQMRAVKALTWRG